MRLRSFGCSFIYGSDLSDCAHGVDNEHPPPSRFSWPALLAQCHGLNYECHARPAAGNLQILESLLSAIDPAQDDLYLVNWTWIDRFSFITESNKSHGHPWNPQGWCSILPSAENPIAELYYKQIHSQFRDKLETLICIKTAIDMLRDNNMKFVMTYTDELIFETKWHTSAAVLKLQDSIRPHVVDFQGLSFWAWAKHNQFKTSVGWHPLDDAHRAAADVMRPVIASILHKA